MSAPEWDSHELLGRSEGVGEIAESGQTTGQVTYKISGIGARVEQVARRQMIITMRLTNGRFPAPGRDPLSLKLEDGQTLSFGREIPLRLADGTYIVTVDERSFPRPQAS